MSGHPAILCQVFYDSAYPIENVVGDINDG